MKGNRFMSPRQAAQRLGVSKSQVLLLVHAGKLEAYKFPGARRYVIPEPAVEEFIGNFEPIRPTRPEVER
jgi:excisionase family DNA binding protein